jgi:signal transduction histidine kinase
VRAMVAQAKSAERSLPPAAAASRDTIGLIERTAEQTLSDLRRGLEVLDPADPVVAQRGSLPTMSQLSALVTEVKMAGLPVDLKIEGDAVPLPAEVDGSAYRIVQEALTSCLKRPGTARPLVVIRYGEEDLELQVTDAREGGAWQVDPGRGRYENLGWMQPRPTDQEAGPEAWPEGSYGVLARLPLAPVRP